ncbi:mtDNA inheritance, partitioning of the mitochondrial organelle [Vermiconidia calcicola]|uniref:MtDNA inheritance, partitioning of the mitochondrial organelle n=1 Tax=Vermiconidia calcicola TaxID=1690605 RepID=A0ACC3NHD8_9PEZI|nr:mtDNA inheritance, partitioning of the mitochondrial organelle [Vermiconidia calcicola]
MHEVVTLQFGQQANYLGTHFWNTQESYFTYAGQEESPVDHDISFRAGIGADGNDTYTPRTLIYDLKGAFGTLRRENALYELQHQPDPTQQGPWGGSTIPLQLPSIAPSMYQQALDQGTSPPQLTTDTVRFWSDYNHLFYHPRSIVQLNQYELNSSLMPFEKWQSGEELFSNLDREHDLLDRDLRPSLEECDQLQALQIFTSTDDAWGGFTSRYLERISDELGKGCRWVFGLKDGKQNTRETQMLQFSNWAQSLYGMDAHASVHIPVSTPPSLLPPYVHLDAYSPWHTSALATAMVESITMPARLRSPEAARATYDQMEATLNNEGNRRIAAASISIEDPGALQSGAEEGGQHDSRMTNGITNGDMHDEETKDDLAMFPHMFGGNVGHGRRLGRKTYTFSRVESLRGPWKSSEEIESMNIESRDRFAGGLRTSTHQCQLLFPILSSYPRIFNFDGRPERIAIKTTLSASTAVADQVRELERMSRRLIGIDEREAVCDGLASIADEYEEGWSESDESGDDD